MVDLCYADLHPALPEGEEAGLRADGLNICSREVVLNIKHRFVQSTVVLLCPAGGGGGAIFVFNR